MEDSPLTLQQRVLEKNPKRPVSALALDYRHMETNANMSGMSDLQDVDMQDAGPSTAPLQGSDSAYFQAS